MGRIVYAETVEVDEDNIFTKVRERVRIIGEENPEWESLRWSVRSWVDDDGTAGGSIVIIDDEGVDWYHVLKGLLQLTAIIVFAMLVAYVLTGE